MSLKDELDQFGTLFKSHLNSSVKATMRWVTVTEVNWDEKTMTGTDSDDLEYFGILLGAGMVTVKPAKGSDCLIAIVEGDEATSFLIMADVTDLIQFNSGENGGIAIVPELVSQLDKLTARVDGIIDAIKSPTVVATPQDGGTALLALLRTEIAKIVDKENFGDIEDKTITH